MRTAEAPFSKHSNRRFFVLEYSWADYGRRCGNTALWRRGLGLANSLLNAPPCPQQYVIRDSGPRSLIAILYVIPCTSVFCLPQNSFANC
jgi:hypothetical protein